MSCGRVRRLRAVPVIGLLAVCLAAMAWSLRDPRRSLPTLSVTPAVELDSSVTVRVCLTEKPVSQLALRIDADWQAYLPGTEQAIGGGPSTGPVVVRAERRGVRIGGVVLPSRRVVIRPARSPAIWVGDHQYRGDVHVAVRPDGRLVCVNHVGLEHYVASVVDGEMPARFPTAARQAQAVVARSYVLHQRQLAGSRLFDVYAGTRSQKYLGYQYRTSNGRRLAGEGAAARQAAADTRGIVCTYRQRLFATYYSAVCGGATTDGRRVFADAVDPVAVSRQCDWCREAGLYRWQKSLDRKPLERKLLDYLRKRGTPLAKIDALTTTPLELVVRGGGGQQAISWTDVRYRLFNELPSPRVERVELSEDVVRFHGRGHGHGVGLCQWGAAGQAADARNWQQILAYYYPGARLVRLDDGG